MLFNSYEFIVFFLPITLIFYYVIGRMGYTKVAISFVIAASLFFYGYWNHIYLWLISLSILFNYTIGSMLGSQKIELDHKRSIIQKALLIFGVSINLSLLGYFKYGNFFIDNLNFFVGVDFHIKKILLPLAISFFTFQQITFLVDSYKGETKGYSFLHYCLFVTFFPQLIAGPIVHHKEMMPQFVKNQIGRIDHENFSVGLTIFIIGLFKKVILADGISLYSTPIFLSAEQSAIPFFGAWSGALAYTFQIYFDFSGYSDMAIGIGRLFGISLPMNFNSPYKAHNIIEFWRRWHITLSRFFRVYLYIPLGGNRKGNLRRYMCLMITMLLGGLWHGAGWTFVIWGILHGCYLSINHGFRLFRKSLGSGLNQDSRYEIIASKVLTFAVVVIAWVFFRAETFTGAFNILGGMVGINGFIKPDAFNYPLIIKLLLLLFIAWYAPNTQEFMKNFKPTLESFQHARNGLIKSRFIWNPNVYWGVIFSIGFLISLFTLSSSSEFLYFQF